MAGSAIVSALLKARPHGSIRASFRRTLPAIHDERVEHVRVDLSDRHAVTGALTGCEVAILVAAEGGGIRMLSEEPWRQVGPNLTLASTWLEALHDARIPRALVVGSATCYQPFDGAIREAQLDWNQDPSPEAFGVGWVTRTIEKLCEFWSRSAGMDIVRVRSANIYGPRARFDPARSNFIPALIRKVEECRGTLEVWGSPHVTRDVIYSRDFGDAIARLVDQPNVGGRVFNVGSGQAICVDDVVRALLHLTDNDDVEVLYSASDPSSARSRVLNCDALFKELSWTPQTTLEEGLRQTLGWWRANRTTWIK